jgi:aminopeptidase N
MYRTHPHRHPLEDYRPPEFLIDRVDLHFDLDPEATVVAARSGAPPQPRGDPGRRHLPWTGSSWSWDIALDGRALTPAEYRADASTLHPAPGARTASAHHPRAHPPGAEHRARGTLPVSGDHALHPVRGGGLPAHHLLPGPPRRDGPLRVTLVADRRATRCCSPTATRRGGRLPDGRHLARWEDPFPKPSYLFALVAGDLARSPTASPPPPAARWTAHLRRAREPGQVRPRHGLAQAGHALGRGALRARVRPRRLHDRRGEPLQHGRHGEQGAQRLQRQVRAGPAGHRHRPGLRGDRGGHRPRVLPQLDRQPHHLPGLVPAEPQGGLHRLPRPGVLRRHGLPRGQAHRRRAHAAGPPVRRGRGPHGPPGAPDSYIEINNFYTATVYEKGAELVRMQANLLGPRRSAGPPTSTSSATTARR